MATTYHEIIVKGDDKLLRGFIRGFQTGRSGKGEIHICGDLPVDKRHLAKTPAFRGEYTHLICAAGTRQGLLAAFARAADLELEVVSDAQIERAYFEFEFETFSRDAAAGIKGLLASIPAGLRLLDYAPDETIDEKARGVELYSPVHEYRLRGKGRVEGKFGPVLSFRGTLAANEFFEVEDIVVERRAPGA